MCSGLKCGEEFGIDVLSFGSRALVGVIPAPVDRFCMNELNGRASQARKIVVFRESEIKNNNSDLRWSLIGSHYLSLSLVFPSLPWFLPHDLRQWL